MNKKYFSTLLISSILIGVTACNNIGKSGAGADRAHFIEIQYVDSAVKPANDFYKFVNGKWLDTAKIPGDKTSIGGFNQLYDETQLKLKDILEDAQKNPGDNGSIKQKVGDLYASGMDTAEIEKRGYEPIKPLLSSVDEIEDVPSLMQWVANDDKNGNGSIIAFNVGPDQKNSTMTIAAFSQAGIGLPDRDYYFNNDSASISIQNAYKSFLKSVFLLSGVDEATASKNVDIVYNIEKQIAASHKTRVQLRDVEGNYHKMAVSDLAQKQGNINWTNYFKNIGANVDSVDMEQPEYYTKLNQLLKSVPIDDWKVYLKANILTSNANLLSKSFRDASFNYSKVMSGLTAQKPRWQTMVSSVDNHLGEALGQLFVEKYFPPEAKQRMDELVSNLTKAFSNRIEHLDWMSSETKKVAHEKLNAIVRNIGYPSKWRDYSKVSIDKTKYFENVAACIKNDFEYEMSQLGKPVDRTLWSMTPPTINAYYDPTTNEIVFPAGILQFPFFDKDADDAVNYGAIGMVIGHEMTHGFDDQGSQYDKNGNIHDWWSKEDKEKFNVKVKAIQALYSSFTILNGVHVNGELTTGENMADFGGISIAYDAFKLTKQGQSDTKIDGYTPDQRFFMSLAQIWREKTTEATQRQYINLDPHSPAKWRVNGPLMNFDPFYKVYNVQPKDSMYRTEQDRIRIW